MESHQRTEDIVAEPARGRRGIVTTLLVLAAVLGIIASFAVWSARQLLDADQWTSTSSRLLENEQIRTAVGGFMVDQLFDNVDVQGEIAQVLPPRLSLLAGPAAGGLRQLAEEEAPKLLARPRAQALWEQINRATQQRFLAVINGDAPALSDSKDEVYLDLGVIVKQLGSNLGIAAAAKIPPGVARLDVMSAEDLNAAQDAVKLLKGIAYILSALTLLLLALAVYLAAGWRRVAIRSCGFVFVAIGIVVIAGRSLTGSFVVDALAPTAAAQPAANAAWSVSTSLLGDVGTAMIGYGVAIVLGAWLAGPGVLASRARRSITPVLRDRRILYPVLGLIALLVFAWSPTEGTRRLIPSAILIFLLIGGAEALRRLAVAEFPDATLDAMTARWRRRIDAVAAGVRVPDLDRRSREGAPTAVEGGDDRISQLERLAALHRAGVLDSEELSSEKQRILTGG